MGPSRIGFALWLAIVLALHPACAPVRVTARLDPTSGPYVGGPVAPEAVFPSGASGHGAMSVTYPDGSSCPGEYKTLLSGGDTLVVKLWYDAPLTEILGTVGLNMAYGAASAVCADGTLIECVYKVSLLDNHGTGRCRDTRDGEYRLRF